MPAIGDPVLGGIETWIFDLDNTLYPASCRLFDQIHANMTRFIAERLDLSPESALALQKTYFREHGTTLRGLMTVDRIDPDDFLDPRLHQGYVVASRLIIGDSAGFIDGFRPAHQNAFPPGLTVERRYTTPGRDPLDAVVWERRRIRIVRSDGSPLFTLDEAEVPAGWSQLAGEIAASKYFRGRGLFENGERGETSIRQVIARIVRSIRRAGDEMGGYFASNGDGAAFEAELSYLLVRQYGAFNSPVWYNCGLWHSYGLEGTGGAWAWDPETRAIVETTSAYERPQC